MRFTPQQQSEMIGGLVALAIAYAGIFYGLYAFGRPGVAMLLFSVPIGVAIGWLVSKAITSSASADTTR